MWSDSKHIEFDIGVVYEFLMTHVCHFALAIEESKERQQEEGATIAIEKGN